MRCLPKVALVAVIPCVLAVTRVAVAETIVIGGVNSNNCMPFGACGYAGAYQQIYLGASFPGPVTIGQIAFALRDDINPTTLINDFSLGLSTTSRPVFALSTDYSANRGTDFTTVFSGIHTMFAPAIGGGGFDFLIDIVPFTYNPAAGNLLMDVFINSSIALNGSRSFRAGGDAPDSLRVFNNAGTGPARRDNISLRTQFTTTAPVPEPGALLLVGTGIAGLLARRRRRR